MNPNSTNNFFGVKVSKAGIPVNQASDKQLVYKDDFSTKTYYDLSNPRMIEGLLPDGTYGLWVSKPGFDVTDANAPTNNTLIFNSSQDVFKIVLTGSTTLTRLAGNTTGTKTIAHNLGFVPAAQCFIEVAGAFLPLPYTETTPTGLGYMGVDKDVGYSTDATNLNLFTDVDTAGFWVGLTENFTIRYYLLQETAN